MTPQARARLGQRREHGGREVATPTGSQPALEHSAGLLELAVGVVRVTELVVGLSQTCGTGHLLGQFDSLTGVGEGALRGSPPAFQRCVVAVGDAADTKVSSLGRQLDHPVECAPGLVEPARAGERGCPQLQETLGRGMGRDRAESPKSVDLIVEYGQAPIDRAGEGESRREREHRRGAKLGFHDLVRS